MTRAALGLLLFAACLRAETPGSVDVKGSVGNAVFEHQENHLQVGGSIRFYVTRRFSIEPEFQYLQGAAAHNDILLIPNVNWDFREGRVVPYVTGGVGWMRSTFGQFGPRFSSNEGFLQVGAGVKLYVTDRWYVAPEFRAGIDFHVRAGVAIGYTFRR